MIVYGRNPVHEAIRGPRTVKRVWASSGAGREPWLAPLAAITSAADPQDIERLCGSDGHQGVCAEVSAYRYADADELLALPDALIIALDQVQDPQNLGAIARTAECAGASGLILPERRSAEVTPAVCKASAGAAEHLPIAKIRNLADFLAAAKRAGLWCYGADASGPSPYREIKFGGPTVLVLGSEGRGLRQRVAGACDALVSIPLRGKIDSLSVSAAAAVLIYAAAADRQGNLQGA
ncbi:MAG: 23S rRNA (guanosine(2251)-2'-O)-methyltransferase RlmB [Solirubrobacteraceae bacterium]